MAVNKPNGQRAPYRSLSFRDMFKAAFNKSGLLKMDGDLTEGVGTVTVPAFSFVQDGLLVNKDSPITINIPPTIQAPYFLTVTSTNPANVDNLSFQFAKAPQDVASTVVLVAEWDGLEWRKMPFLAISELLELIKTQNVEFGRVGPVNGLLTTINGSNYEVSGGVIIDPTGRQVSLPEVFVTPIVAVDPDWSRVDRMVYRLPRDSDDRVGVRELVVGGTYDAIKTLHDTQIASGTTRHQTVKVLVAADNTVHFITAQGYGTSFTLMYSKYNATRTAQLVAPTALVSAVSGQFDAALDSAGNIHLSYIAGGNYDVMWQRFSSIGASMGAALAVDVLSQPNDYPRVVVDNLDKVIFVWQSAVGPSQYHLYFATKTLTGATITAAIPVVTGAGSYVTPSLFTNEDNLVYVAYASAGKIFYRVFDDIGALFASDTYVSGATDGGTHGTLVDGASFPIIQLSENKEVFVGFLQNKGSANGVAIYHGGSATLNDYTNPSEDILCFSMDVDSFMNEVHLCLGQISRVDYAKAADAMVIMTTALSITGASFVDCRKDRRGSMVHAWSAPFAGTYTNIGAAQSVAHIGPANIVGGMNNLVLTSSEMAFAAPMSYVPTPGDRSTIAGSVAGNNGNRIVQSVSLVSINSANDFYKVKMTTPFAAAETPAVGVTSQFAAPDGNQSRFIKSTAELDAARSLRMDVMSSDILLARIKDSSIIIGYIPNGGNGVDSDLLGIYGNVVVDWEKTLAGNVTITGGLKFLDLVNDILYSPVDASIPMIEGDALYMKFDGVNLTPTYQVIPIEHLPLGDPIGVLGYVKDSIFHPHLLAITALTALQSGEEGSIGSELPANIRARLGILSDTTFKPYFSTIIIDAADDYPDAISKLDQATSIALANTANEDEVIAIAGQTICNFTKISFDDDNTVYDLQLFMGGKKKAQDPTAGLLEDYRKISPVSVEFAYPLKAGVRVVGRMEKTPIILGPTPFFRSDVDGLTGFGIPTGGNYNIGTDKLMAFRNGLVVYKSNSVGLPADRYSESSPASISIGAVAVASDVFTFINIFTTPTYRQFVDSLVGTVLAVPSYVMGSNRLLVLRNGLMLNKSGFGLPADFYSETTSTTLTFGAAAVASDVFTFHNMGVAPLFREEVTGLSGTTLTVGTAYTPGNGRCLVFRKGVLLFNSLTLGVTANDRYQEASSTTFTLGAAAVASDIFVVINLP